MAFSISIEPKQGCLYGDNAPHRITVSHVGLQSEFIYCDTYNEALEKVNEIWQSKTLEEKDSR